MLKLAPVTSRAGVDQELIGRLVVVRIDGDVVVRRGVDLAAREGEGGLESELDVAGDACRKGPALTVSLKFPVFTPTKRSSTNVNWSPVLQMLWSYAVNSTPVVVLLNSLTMLIDGARRSPRRRSRSLSTPP